MIGWVLLIGIITFFLGLALLIGDYDIGVIPFIFGLAIICGLIVTLAIMASPIGESWVICEEYCTDEGMTYDSVKTVGSESYCVCDNSLETHLIIKHEEVIIK